MAFKSLENLLPRALQTAGIVHHVDARQVFEYFTCVMIDVFGPEVVELVKPTGLYKSELVVCSLSREISAELRRCQNRVIDEIENLLGKRVVATIRIEE